MDDGCEYAKMFLRIIEIYLMGKFQRFFVNTNGMHKYAYH